MKVTKTGSRVHPKRSKTTKKTVKIAKKVDVSASLISAVQDGDLVSVKKLIHSYGLSYCECGNGGYLLLFVAIELGRIEIAKLLLQEGAKADCETDNVSTPLHLAARQGFTGLVQLLLEKNIAVDARNSQNETPLHLAAKGGYTEVVEVLLNHNASITAQTNKGATPLFLAAEAEHKTVFRMLFKHAHAPVNLKDSAEMKSSTLLKHALLCNPSICEKVKKIAAYDVTQDDGHSELLDELFDQGFILSCEFLNESLLSAAINENNIKLLHSIFTIKANHNIAENYPQLLHTAVKIGRVEIAKIFLNSGFDVDATDGKGKTPLCYSLVCGEDVKYVEIVWLLLAYGADITKAPDLLHEAVAKGLIEVCKVLIENRADVNKLDTDGRTPLFLAVSDEGSSVADEQESEGSNQIEEATRHKIVELLFNRGADVNINVHGFTPFHYAVLIGKTRTVSTFLGCGVDVDTCAEDGSTPLYLAARDGDTDIVEILCENNADVNMGLGEISPLYMAALNKKVKVVLLLLKFGAEIGFDRDKVFRCCTRFKDLNIQANYMYLEVIISDHVRRLKTAGLFFGSGYWDYSDSFYSRKECEEEIERLKNQRLNPRLTLYNVLMSGTNPVYAKKRLLMQKLESFNFERFPIYRDFITSNVRKCKFRLQLLQSGQKWLDILVKTSNKLNAKKNSPLPVEVLDQIVSYLSNSEVKCLILCGEALKHKLRY